MTRRLLARLVSLPLVLCFAACQKSPAPPAAAAAPAGPVRIVATEFAYTGVPDTLQAGWHDIRVVNQGKQPHMAVFARLDSGKTVADYLAAAKGQTPMPWATEVGGVNAVLPGDSLMTAANLNPGTYALVCWVPDSAGVPHLLDGMAATFTVANTGVAAIPEPTTTDTVQLTSYKIAFSTPPTTGSHVYRVEDADTAAIDHDFVVVRIADGKTQKDVMAWLGKLSGPPPFTVSGATTGMARGLHADVHVDFTPGDYLAFCLMTDKRSPKPHVMLGMQTAFSVKD